MISMVSWGFAQEKSPTQDPRARALEVLILMIDNSDEMEKSVPELQAFDQGVGQAYEQPFFDDIKQAIAREKQANDAVDALGFIGNTKPFSDTIKIFCCAWGGFVIALYVVVTDLPELIIPE